MMSSKKQKISHQYVVEKKNFINNLTYDSLEKIFDLLPVSYRFELAKVCQKWKEASDISWYHVKKYKCGESIGRPYKNKKLTQSYVKRILLKCGKYLNELALSKVCKSGIMQLVGEHCKNLTILEFHLNLESSTTNFNVYVHAFSHLTLLKNIKINFLSDYKESNTSFLVELFNNLSEEINVIHLFFYKNPLEAVTGNTGQLLFSLKKFKKLHSLTLRECNLDNIIQEISEITTLVYLDLQGCLTIHKDFLLFDRLVNLEHINIDTSHRFNITSDVINNIFDSCKNIKYLDIPNGNYNFKISKNSWPNLQNLEHSNAIWNMTEDFAIDFVHYCKNIKNLTLDHRISSYNLTDIAFKELTKLENLEYLEYEPKFFEDESIIAITNNFKKLKHLQINGCDTITPSVLDELSKLQYLEHLDLSSSSKLFDKTIIAIANKCKNLIYLNIERCKNITEAALMALTNLTNLKTLKVNFNNNVTNNFISKLRGLKILHCHSCFNLTNTGIIKLLKNCPHLEQFDIRFIENIKCDTILVADKVTKYRTNDITLTMVVSIQGLELQKARKIDIKSSWLNVCINL